MYYKKKIELNYPIARFSVMLPRCIECRKFYKKNIKQETNDTMNKIISAIGSK